MPGICPEDAQEKIPALIHLTRLGYRYLSLSETRRDRGTNILPEILRESVIRINGRLMSDTEFGILFSEIQSSLDLEDLGKTFYQGLRNSWKGVRLIDYTHPDHNRFHVMTELPYIGGQNRFRPDITLFVNGLPLAFIELKNKGPKEGIRSEYSRMISRSRNPAFLRFINLTQLMVFSNDEEYNENELLPVRGAFYATSTYNDLAVHPFEEERENSCRIKTPDPNEVSRILRDNQADALSDDPAFLSSLSPDSPTHRLLTSLFRAQRFLFFLQYGIFYSAAGGADKKTHVEKRVIRPPQLFAIRYLDRRLQNRQSECILYVNRGGRPEIAYALIHYMNDYFGKFSRQVQYDYLTDSPALVQILWNTFRSLGFRVQKMTKAASLDPGIMRERNLELPSGPQIFLYCLPDFTGFKKPELSRGWSPVQRVCFLDGIMNAYTSGISLLSRLRREDPQAFWIIFSDEQNHISLN